MNKNDVQEIDIEKIIQAKMGDKKKLPKWLIKFIKKIIHQDYINGYLKEGYVGVPFCENCLKYLNVKIEIDGLENLPDEGKYTFVSNHPLGGIDGVALGAIIGKKYNGNIKFLLNDFLMSLGGMAPLGIPINKVGGQARNLPKLISDTFNSDNQMIVFPAGLCSRKIKGKVQDLPWTKTFITKSIQTRRDIIPIHFIGENSKRFYRVANLCKMLKLKFNLAMVLLPDELYKGQGKTFKVIIGKPVPYTTFDKSKSMLEWAQIIREQVYSLEPLNE